MSKLTKFEAMEIVNKIKDVTHYSQFDKKQAYIGDIHYVGELSYQLFRSYDTVVALIDISNKVFYRLGYWSPTTSKQTTAFYTKWYSKFEQVQFED